MSRFAAPLLIALALTGGCGDPPHEEPAPAPTPVDAEALARAYLEATPRTTIAALGGDHEKKVMPLVGELQDPVLTRVFPDHRFFEFSVSMFSGRRDPRAYVVVSDRGDTREILVYRDFGQDPRFEAFLREQVRLAPPREAAAAEVCAACLVLRGDGGRAAAPRADEAPGGGLTVAGGGFRLLFDARGRLLEMVMQ